MFSSWPNPIRAWAIKLRPGLQCLPDSHPPLIAIVHHLSTWQKLCPSIFTKLADVYIIEGTAPPEDRFVALIPCDNPALQPNLHTHPLLPNAAHLKAELHFAVLSRMGVCPFSNFIEKGEPAKGWAQTPGPSSPLSQSCSFWWSPGWDLTWSTTYHLLTPWAEAFPPGEGIGHIDPQPGWVGVQNSGYLDSGQ